MRSAGGHLHWRTRRGHGQEGAVGEGGRARCAALAMQWSGVEWSRVEWGKVKYGRVECGGVQRGGVEWGGVFIF